MRYFIELSYKGTEYAGWQRQLNALSVQEVIENSMSRLMRETVEIVGCGRTDAGVHARKYIAHFETENQNVLTGDFVYHLNAILPQDIAVRQIYQSDKHARFDAKSREYKYIISYRKNPFWDDYSWHISIPLDLGSMIQASEKLKSYQDFASMCRVGSDNKTTLCQIHEISWKEGDDKLIFTVSADRFLRGMVRAMVGTLVDIGRGRTSLHDLEMIMEAQNRSAAGQSAPPKALFLTDIKY